MRRRRPLLGVALPLLVTAAACSSAARPETSRADVSFVFAHGLVFVEVDTPVHGSRLALVDTGANASAVDPEWSRDLDVEEVVDVVGTTGAVPAEIVRVEGLRVGGIRLDPLRATRRDLRGLLSPDGRAVGMILGSDAFAGRALTLDFEARRLELADSIAPSRGAGVAMALDQGIPAIDAELGGLRLWLRIDTGASLFESDAVFVNVPPHVWDEVRQRQPDARPAMQLAGTGADGRTVDLSVGMLAGNSHVSLGLRVA